MSTGSVLLRRAEVSDSIVDVRCDGGRITYIGDPGSVPGGDTVVDVDGCAVVPGLHDHHIHLLAYAAARSSLDVSTARDARALDAVVRRYAASHPERSWIRAVGYHEAVHGELDRARLDALAPGRLVRVQHRTGAMWVLSSAAVDACVLEGVGAPGVERDTGGVPTGRLFGADEALHARFGREVPDVAGAARTLASFGVTGVTDLTPTEDPSHVEALSAAARAPGFPLHVVVTGGPRLAPDAAPDLRRGPVKIVVADHRLPSLDDLVSDYRRARRARRCVAVHCVSRVALVLALAAWEQVGAEPGDRVEHGAVIPLELFGRVRELGLVIVTQPRFVAERGDEYLVEVEPDDVPHLWRCASLLRRGIGVAGSTDAPYGHADPWRAIAAAVDRRTPSGRVVGATERLDPATALRLFLSAPGDPAGPPRQVRVGAAADLCVLGEPLAPALDDPSAATVVATIGRAGVTWAAGDDPLR